MNWTQMNRRRFLCGVGSLPASTALGTIFLNQASTASAQGLGSSLIGELEGPEVVLDPARIPTAFSQAPEFETKVASGSLPPVDERVSKHPLVLEPLHEIGRYGGVMRRGFTGPGDVWNGWRTASGPDQLLYWDYSGSVIVPNIARDWEVSEDGMSTTFWLREGMKWSDGSPFTTDDFVFWFEEIYSNEDLVPFDSSYFSAGGLNGRIEKIDDYIMRFVFDKPYYGLPEIVAGTNDLAGHAQQGRTGLGLFAPAHYLKQYLPKFTDQATLDKMATDAGFDSWRTHFFFKNNWGLNVELPVVTPWIVSRPSNETTWEFSRNPYSIWVDTAGNQLPYVDKIVMSLAEDLEVVNLRAIAGEYDMQERHLDIAKLPVFLQNKEAGDYDVHLDPGAHGADVMLIFNQSYQADSEIAKWMNNVEFRKALSMGVDRDELNEIFWLGLGQPSTIAPESRNQYFPGDEYRLKYSTLDVDKANEMLDAMGLSAKDSEGFRLRSDNGERLSINMIVYAGSAMPYGQICEMVAQQWRAIGIELTVDALERSLVNARRLANDFQMHSWVGDGTEHLFSYAAQVLPIFAGHYSAPLWGRWFVTDGAEGVEPDDYMKKAVENFRVGLNKKEEDRVELAKEIWRLLIDNMSIIGTVGLSPAFMGVRVTKRNLGNVPARQYNSPDVKTSGASRPMTMYFKD